MGLFGSNSVELSSDIQSLRYTLTILNPGLPKYELPLGGEWVPLDSIAQSFPQTFRVCLMILNPALGKKLTILIQDSWRKST